MLYRGNSILIHLQIKKFQFEKNFLKATSNNVELLFLLEDTLYMLKFGDFRLYI